MIKATGADTIVIHSDTIGTISDTISDTIGTIYDTILDTNDTIPVTIYEALIYSCK